MEFTFVLHLFERTYFKKFKIIQQRVSSRYTDGEVLLLHMTYIYLETIVLVIVNIY